MPRASQRAKAFSEDECKVLVEEVGKTAGKPLVSITDSSPRTIQRKAWEAVADSMANVTNIRRTGEEIREKFKRMLQSAEKRQKNGEPLSTRETRVLELCGSARGDILPGDPGSSAGGKGKGDGDGDAADDESSDDAGESPGDGAARRGAKRPASSDRPGTSKAPRMDPQGGCDSAILEAILQELRNISSSLTTLVERKWSPGKGRLKLTLHPQTATALLDGASSSKRSENS
ncbi:unnamed protein product [Darwinula stevensoni]|uniref:Regulatory protein zeste n=1 Tax=Darwinula stevensoni TaxID=69355 RepID=A0A7R8XIT5_9CRUS|nr:unnamed protein product [Darwinula stevensoni]CAG0894159.1 unnamed protein product [Darwinula stevensoni]